MITLNNIKILQTEYSVIKKQYVTGNNTKPRYRLLEDLCVELSDGNIITIPKGFVWDLSSVPRVFWWLLPPDGDFGIAYIIHDYLWINKKLFNYSQKWTDQEMLRWAKASNGTQNISMRNADNYARYYGVRTFGWIVWKGYVKI